MCWLNAFGAKRADPWLLGVAGLVEVHARAQLQKSQVRGLGQGMAHTAVARVVGLSNVRAETLTDQRAPPRCTQVVRHVAHLSFPNIVDLVQVLEQSVNIVTDDMTGWHAPLAQVPVRVHCLLQLY
jgi:hypothetical protein